MEKLQRSWIAGRKGEKKSNPAVSQIKAVVRLDTSRSQTSKTLGALSACKNHLLIAL